MKQRVRGGRVTELAPQLVKFGPLRQDKRPDTKKDAGPSALDSLLSGKVVLRSLSLAQARVCKHPHSLQ